VLLRLSGLAYLLALLLTAPANATSLEDLRAPLLSGGFSRASAAPAADTAGDPALAANAAYYRGLAAFALKDYPTAVSALLQVTEQHGDKPVALRAAVVATLALSQQGDRDNACQYVGIVLPLTATMSPIWRAWVEEAQRKSACQ
jgi:tetratricopeptide (TPR) repeat protein